MKKRLTVTVILDDECEAYLIKCARIRDISAGRLITRLLKVVSESQLMGAILDDDGARVTAKGQHKFRYHNRVYPL